MRACVGKYFLLMVVSFFGASAVDYQLFADDMCESSFSDTDKSKKDQTNQEELKELIKGKTKQFLFQNEMVISVYEEFFDKKGKLLTQKKLFEKMDIVRLIESLHSSLTDTFQLFNSSFKIPTSKDNRYLTREEEYYVSKFIQYLLTIKTLDINKKTKKRFGDYEADILSKAREVLMFYNARLFVKFYNRGLKINDEQCLSILLEEYLYATTAYDYRYGTRFNTVAFVYLRKALQKIHHYENKSSKLKTSSYEELSDNFFGFTESNVNIDLIESLRQFHSEVLPAFYRTLSLREKDIFIHRFSLSNQEVYTLKRLGITWGVSKERIRQEETYIMSKFRTFIESNRKYQTLVENILNP